MVTLHPHSEISCVQGGMTRDTPTSRKMKEMNSTAHQAYCLLSAKYNPLEGATHTQGGYEPRITTVQKLSPTCLKPRFVSQVIVHSFGLTRKINSHTQCWQSTAYQAHSSTSASSWPCFHNVIISELLTLCFENAMPKLPKRVSTSLTFTGQDLDPRDLQKTAHSHTSGREQCWPFL